jgi:Major tropism determinant N-terminal domain
MAMTIKLRRLSTAQRLAVTPTSGEPVLDLTSRMLYVGDGITAGGLPVVGNFAISETFVANSQSAMLALATAEKGDFCIRTDLSRTYVLAGINFSVAGDWQEFLTPTDAVFSVNAKAGTVLLTVDDIPGAAPLANPIFTGTPTAPTAGAGDDSSKLATTAFIKNALDNLTVDGGIA